MYIRQESTFHHQRFPIQALRLLVVTVFVEHMPEVVLCLGQVGVRIALHFESNRNRLAKQRHGAFVVALIKEIQCEIFQALRDIGMPVTQKFAAHCKCFTQ